jgi:SAM-dependent methyltransferase
MVTLPYIDAEIERMDAGGEPPGYLRHFHWGHYDDPADLDDDPKRYFAAAEAMTERVVAAGDVTDGRRVLDVGCGFGGTLDHIRGRNRGCRLSGVNIDERQLQWARRLMGDGPEAISFVTADGCQLPVATGVVDHVLAVECVFHFPSRKRFFREAARALRPGGALVLIDDVLTAPSPSTDHRLVDFRAGWHVSSLLSVAEAAALAADAGLDLAASVDLSPRQRLGRPRDRLIGLAQPALRGLRGRSAWAESLVGGHALQQCHRAGLLEYRLLRFVRR